MKFDKRWFKKNQAGLVRFANSFIGRRFFAYEKTFGISPKRVLEITPSSISYDWKLEGGMVRKKSCFATNNHYAIKFERTYARLKSLVPQAVAWKVLQPTGAMMAFPLVALATTFNPSTGANSPCDSVLQNNDKGSWALARSTDPCDSASDTGGFTYLARALQTGGLYYIYRNFFNFDTSSLGSDIITAADIGFAAEGTAANNADSTSINIVASTAAATNTTGTADFDQVGSTVFGSLALSSFNNTSNTYNDITLDANGLANIDGSGVSQFAERSALDVSNTAPTGNNNAAIWMADHGSFEPRLVVTHEAAPSGSTLALLGAG